MVDYNIAIPQQQLYQAPDPMQNFLRMQQMEQMGATSRLRNMQAQNLLAAQQQTAAERAQAAAIEEEASGAVRGGASPTEAAQNLTREGKLGAAARISAHGETLSKGQQAELDTVDNTLKGFGYWSTHVRSPEEAGSLGAGMFNTSRLRPFFESIGIKTPEQAAQKFSTDFATDENAWRTGLAKLDAPTLFSLRAAKQVELPGGGKGTIDPNRPGVINESVIREAGAQDTYPVSPTRVANMNAAAGRTGNAPIVQDRGQGMRVAMGGPAPGEPVNALAAGQRQQPAVVGNAMAAPPAPASPYGELVPLPAARAPGVVGSGAFAQRVEEKKLAEAIKQEGLKTEARAKAELNVSVPEAQRLKDIGKQEFQGSLAAMVDQYKDLGRQGVLIEKATSLGQRALTFAGAQAPGIAGVVSPEAGGPMQTLTNMRSTLLTGLMAATGMSSKQIDSNKEMQNYLDAMTSPGQTVKTITDTFNELSRKYGTGQTLKPEDISPPRSTGSSGIPSGRKSTARAGNISSMDQQALDWASSNPNDPRAAAIKERLGVR